MAYAFVSAAVTQTATQALTISAGQNIIIIAGDESAQNSTLTISDALGNVYAPRGTVNDTFNGGTRTLLDCLAPTAGSTTLTLAGATAAEFITLVYTGFASFSAGSFKSFFNSSAPTSTDGCATASITPTSYPAGLICGALISGSIGATLTAGTGFTGRLSSVTGGHFGAGCFAEDLRLTAGSNIASWTSGSAAQSVALVAGSYIETAFNPATVAPFTPTMWFVTDTVIQQ